MIKQFLQFSLSALIGFGLVVGCSASVSDDPDLGELGVTSESFTAPEDLHLTFGSTNDIHASRCRLDLGPSQDCRWQRPSVFPPTDGTTAPAHFQIYVNSLGDPNASATFAVVTTIASALNSQFSPFVTFDVTQHAVTGNVIDFEPVRRGAVVSGDTLISDYLNVTRTGCSAPWAECLAPNLCPHDIPGTFRDCTSTVVSFDTGNLRAAFANSRFPDNLRQLVANGLLKAVGLGEQVQGTAYSSPRLDTAAQALTFYATQGEAKTIKKVGATYSATFNSITVTP